MTQRLPTAMARKDFASILRSSEAGERIKLTRYNKTVAVIIPKKDLAELEDCQKSRAERAPAHGGDGKEPRAHLGKPSRAHK
ncbi:MAG TPA: type II toxin-antitoxin system prevent-host-death family antitoxin [Polyangia bacterium]|jgi:prevent-host-death family protein|nr:type II toxin-antitoxin system prevent-host-death family antitoxin [Polyangia bacterium]